MILRSVHVLLARIIIARSSRYRSILLFAMELVVFRYLALSVQTLYFSLLNAFSTRSGTFCPVWYKPRGCAWWSGAWSSTFRFVRRAIHIENNTKRPTKRSYAGYFSDLFSLVTFRGTRGPWSRKPLSTTGSVAGTGSWSFRSCRLVAKFSLRIFFAEHLSRLHTDSTFGGTLYGPFSVQPLWTFDSRGNSIRLWRFSSTGS